MNSSSRRGRSAASAARSSSSASLARIVSGYSSGTGASEVLQGGTQCGCGIQVGLLTEHLLYGLLGGFHRPAQPGEGGDHVLLPAVQRPGRRDRESVV